MRSNAELIGRADINDVEAVLALVGKQEPDGRHLVADPCPAEFTWDYEKGARAKLDKLYEKAKKAQWNGQTDLPWETEVDQERVVVANPAANNDAMRWANTDFSGTVLEKWDDRDWLRFGMENQNWMLSQFMHGEQGALLCTAKIVETVPWIDAKYYAATQVMDEARHVEVFSKYLDEKLSGPLSDQRPPRAAARRHHRRLPLGHDLPGHADHGGGTGPGGLRLHPRH